MAEVMHTGKQVVVLFVQGCCEEGCGKTWVITRARMFMISDESWGSQRCNSHAAVHGHAKTH